MTKLTKIISLLFIVLALTFRIYSLYQNDVFSDELDVGYQAYSILKTGRDVKNNLLPFYIQSFEESRAPLTIYLTVPFVALLGLNDCAIKLVPVVFSLLTAIYFYKLLQKYSKDNSFSLFSTSLLLLTPYFFHYSVHAFEISILLFLLISGLFYFLIYLESSRLLHLILSIMLFSLTFYNYNTSNIFTPLLVLYLLANHQSFFIRFLKSKNHLILILLPFFLLIPLIYNIFFGQAANRFNLVSIFSNPSSFKEIIDRRTLYQSSPFLDRLLYNRPVYYLKDFFQNYFQTFSLSTLFYSGDPNPRHTPPGFGLFPAVYSVFLLTLLLKKHQKISPLSNIFLYWLLISPIPSSLTQGGGSHATRLSLMIIPIVYFASLGFYRLKNILLKYFLLLVLIFNLTRFYYYYYTAYSVDQYQNWQTNLRQVFSNLPGQYNRLFVSDVSYNTLKPFVFYQKINPHILQTNFDNHSVPLFDNLTGYSLQNIFFVNDWHGLTLDKVSNLAQTGDLFVLFQLKDIPGDYNLLANPIDGFKTISVIKNPDKTIYSQIIQKL